jgi:hypothetical protein
MVNTYLEIERLRTILRNKGLDERSVDEIAKNAENEINSALADLMEGAIDLGVQSGVEKRSADFINELRPRPDAFMLETLSGRSDFSDPPYPMLDNLLKGAKPIADGSGVYKIIPVGKKGDKKPIANNIFDAQKAINAERYEQATARYKTVAPKDSKQTFRTATSKQNRDTQWVQPATEKNFTEDLREINSMLETSAEDTIMSIIRSYEEEF